MVARRDTQRIGFFSPLPPALTEIANHSALILPSLRAQAEVTAYTDQLHHAAPPHGVVRRFSASEFPAADLAAADAVFYNIGNNAPFHTGIWGASRRVPGIVILHDTWLQNLFAGFGATAGGVADYIAIMRRFGGRQAEADAIALAQGRADIRDLMLRYPLTEAATDGSRGVVVHNEAEMRRLRRTLAEPVWYVPLASGPALGSQRRSGGDDTLRLIMFGHIGPNRRVIEAIRALAASPVRGRYRLDIYGTLDSRPALEAVVTELGLIDQVALHGYVPDCDLNEALAKADLALNLRHPTLGEASSSQLRIWANALPSLVTQAGWYASLSPNWVSFVRPEHEAADLQDHLLAFATDPSPYLEQGRAGSLQLGRTHCPDAYASALVEISRELAGDSIVQVLRPPHLQDEPPLRIEGNVETAGDGWIVGWARGLEAGAGPARVALRVGEQVLAEMAADEFRDDVKRSGHGDGWCGFILRVPPIVGQLGEVTFRIVAICGQGEILLFEDRCDRIANPASKDDDTVPVFFLHVTDLLVFGMHSPTVSGIQRVQLGTIASWLADPARRSRCVFTVFSTETHEFHALDQADVSWLVDSLSLKSGSYAARRERLAAILGAVATAPVLTPRDGDVMVITGSFWSFEGLHAALRRMQIVTGLRYVQVYYDAVPTFAPETCPQEGIVAYNRAVVAMLDQADAVFAISHFSAGELRWLAARLGQPCPPVEVIPMGTEAQYGADEAEEEGALPPGLGTFVLCVGTIEPRKNHLYLFNLWRRLLDRMGWPTPKLVCAGRFGWLTEALQHHLAATANLDGAFVTLADVSDAQLRALYRACSFTIYPSVYEGWGLPVSESLSLGKLCVTSAITAMPEAGGDWAAYLDPYDLNDGVRVVSELINNPDLVRTREAEIRRMFRPTSWHEAADALWLRLEALGNGATVRQRRLYRPPVLAMLDEHGLPPHPGGMAPLGIARSQLAMIRFGQVLFGPDWHPVEPWGAWARGRVARLTFQTETVTDDAVIGYLRVSLPEGGGHFGCSVIVNGQQVGEYGLVPGLNSVRVPLGDGGRIRLDLVVHGDVWAPGDHRHLGIGMQRLFVCRAGDVAARLAFLES